MELSNECLIMLECMNTPAFFADQQSIVHVNQKASALGINTGAKVDELLNKNHLELVEQDCNSLLLTRLHGVNYTVSITSIGALHLFILKKSEDPNQLQGLERAAQQLRVPLTALASSIRLIKESEAPKSPDNIKYFNKATKQLFTLQRAVRNMSDACMFFKDRSTKKEYTDVTAHLLEISQKLTHRLEGSAIDLTFSYPSEQICCSIDKGLLERALYNMVSNSLKAESKHIEISLTKKNNTLFLTVQDDGCGISDAEKQSILSRFKEEPSWSMDRLGLGLGMMIIHAAACAHNGTMLISDHAPHGCKITITITIEKEPTMLKQKPALINIDPLGGTDQLLLELSDILPPENFE